MTNVLQEARELLAAYDASKWDESGESIECVYKMPEVLRYLITQAETWQQEQAAYIAKLEDKIKRKDAYIHWLDSAYRKQYDALKDD